MKVTDTGDARRDDRARSLAGLYDADYFASHLGTPYRWGDGVWEGIFGRIADAIVAQLKPTTVLDAGCAIGFLVDALRERGVEAYGLDISAYAIAQVPEAIRPFCRVASVTEELDRDYDLIVCIEVLEHLPPELAEPAIDNLTQHTNQILFSSTPSDVTEETHFGVRPMQEWIELFARRGFYRNVDVDADFVARHAVHLVRSNTTTVGVASDYERWHWSERLELETEIERTQSEAGRLEGEITRWQGEERRWREEERRWHDEERSLREQLQLAAAELAEWNLFRSRSGYRIFLRLANLRLQLAPRGTTRDRLVRSALRTIAERVDRTGKQVRSLSATTTTTTTKLGAALFVSGCPGDAKRYRCDHQAEELRLVGATVDIAEDGYVDLQEMLTRYAGFILHRVPWSGDVERFFEQARLEGKPVFFDTDDLVFEPEAREHVAALLEMDEAERALYVHGLRRYQRTLRECDGVIVSTEPLQEAALRYHERVEIAYNVVSDEMTRYADAAVSARRGTEGSPAERVTIAYFSGTPTHNLDFAEAADAVLWALERYPEVDFMAVGHLKLDARMLAHGNRVQHMPLQPWQRLPELLARADVNLAPLEPGNPFTECKSCLKYFEAGLVGTPTIASPRSDFARAIEHGRNGLLAESHDEWRAAIQTLVESPEQRLAIGKAAFEDVRRNHTARARPVQLLRSIGAIASRRDERPLEVNCLVRAPIPHAGGYRTIFRLMNHLAAQGHRVRVYVEPIAHLLGMSEKEIVRFVEQHFGPLRVEVHVGHGDIMPADVAIATNWPTAPTIARLDDSLFKLYLIQDFEPEFYEPEDVEALQAEQTYALPLGHVCYGRHLAERLRAHTGKHAWAVDFALEASFRVRVPPAARPEPVKVLFYARPDQPRRGYDLGVRALETLKRERPDVEVLFFGSSDKALGSMPFPVRNLGRIDEERLAVALNEAHVFLGLSLTNISHAPLEAMACGCAVVEVDSPSVTATLKPNENCLVAPPNADRLAAAVHRLVDDRALRIALAERAAADTEDATWERSGAQLEQILLETCFVRLPASALPA